MENNKKTQSANYKIAVSGSADLSICREGVKELAKEVGREIARRNCVIVTGATTGIPYYSAVGAKEANGFSIGFSPATSENAHLKSYKLPVDAFDLVIYTGADYVGRNIMMTKSVDGVIIISGRMGTLHEFATAFEIQKPIAVLEGSGGTADRIRTIIQGPQRGSKKSIIYDENPIALVDKLIRAIEEDKKNNPKIKRPN